MDRAVPFATSEGIDLYLRTFYSLLRSTGPIRVRSLEESHAGMKSSLHLRAESSEPDISAFLYAWLRLPPEIVDVRYVLLGQSEEVFARRGYTEVSAWKAVRAPARRRRMFFDQEETLACFVASISDIDDLIPILTAFQIEWNKMHFALAASDLLATFETRHERGEPLDTSEIERLRVALSLSEEEIDKLQTAWGPDLVTRFCRVGRQEANLYINLLAGSLTDYRKATQGWWHMVEERAGHIDAGQGHRAVLARRPIYFVSSNTHSLPNMLCGYASSYRQALLDFIETYNPENLRLEARRVVDSGDPGLLNNLLFYVQRFYMSQAGHDERADAYREAEREAGILSIRTPAYLDVSCHVIEINKLDPQRCDPRLHLEGMERLARSDALIFNIDYPLGLAAYNILSQVSTSVPEMRGVYFMGKAATLNGRVGDVMIPNVVYDEHSQNTYLFKNCFTVFDVAPYLNYGTVFDNQKSVTVRGTFLQNREFMHIYYREGYTDIEMEAGPYLSALYEDIYPRRYPSNEIVNLFINAPYDIGVLHYASDTPYSRRQELLSKSLSYFGVDATYATTGAILRRILQQEIALAL